MRGAILFVAVIVVLYVIAVVVGQNGGLSGFMPSRESREEWRKEWFRPNDVEAAELRSSCTLEHERLVFSGACSLEIARVPRGSRALRLKAGSSLTLDYRPRGEDAAPLRSKIKPDRSFELMVPPEGAQVLLGCLMPANCVVALE